MCVCVGVRVCVSGLFAAPPASPVPLAAPRCVVSGQQRPQVSQRAAGAGGHRRGVELMGACHGGSRGVHERFWRIKK